MYTTFCASFLHLVVIAWERYIAVQKWEKYKAIVTKGRIKKYALIAYRIAYRIFLLGNLHRSAQLEPKQNPPTQCFDHSKAEKKSCLYLCLANSFRWGRNRTDHRSFRLRERNFTCSSYEFAFPMVKNSASIQRSPQSYFLLLPRSRVSKSCVGTIRNQKPERIQLVTREAPECVHRFQRRRDSVASIDFRLIEQPPRLMRSQSPNRINRAHA